MWLESWRTQRSIIRPLRPDRGIGIDRQMTGASHKPRLCSLLIGLLLTGLACLAHQQEPPTQDSEASPSASHVRIRPQVLPADSDAGSLWYLKPLHPLDGPTYRVMHHSLVHESGQANDAFGLKDRPVAMIAIDDLVYLIFDPPNSRSQSSADSTSSSGSDLEPTPRIVSRVRAGFNASTQSWTYWPIGMTERVAGLPASEELVDAVSDGRAPLVLLRGSEPESASVRYRLLSLDQSDMWVEISLPADLPAHPDLALRLLAATNPTILAGSQDSDAPARVYKRSSAGHWEFLESNLDPTLIENSCVLDGVTCVALTDGGDPRSVGIGFLRNGEFAAVTVLKNRAHHRKLVTIDHALAMAEQPTMNESVKITTIDYTTGHVTEAAELVPLLPLGHDDFGLLILVGSLVISLLILAIFRPNPATIQPNLPRTVALARPFDRFVAVLIDLVPAIILSSLILEVPISRVISPPAFLVGWSNAEPALLAIGLCVLISTLFECFLGRTIGKFFTDCRVVTLDGKRPSVLQVVVRNLMKGFALLLPPLFALVLMNPYRQHLGDLVARTLVVSDLGPEAKQGPG